MDAIGELLTCPQCVERFVEPCMLPCGQSLCRKCIDERSLPPSPPRPRPPPPSPDQATSDQDHGQERADQEQDAVEARDLSCVACSSSHPIPERGFPLNLHLIKILEARQQRDDLNNAEEPSASSTASNVVETSLATLAACRAQLDDLTSSHDTRIKQHLDLVRHDVQVARDRAITHVLACQHEYVARIDGYEASCLSKVARCVDDERDRVEDQLVAAEKLLANVWHYLDQFSIDDDRVLAAIGEADAMRVALDTLCDELSGASLLDRRSICFVAAENVVSSPCDNLLGALSFEADDASPNSLESSQLDESKDAATDSNVNNSVDHTDGCHADSFLSVESSHQAGLAVADVSASLRVDWKRMKVYNLRSCLSVKSASFLHVLPMEAKAFEFVLFYRMADAVYLKWSDNRCRSTLVWEVRDQARLADAECLVCHYNGDGSSSSSSGSGGQILVYVRQSNNKAALKLYRSSNLRWVQSMAITAKANATICCLAMNGTRVFCATLDKTVLILDKTLQTTIKRNWPHHVEQLHATDELLIIRDAARNLTVINADTLRKTRVIAMDAELSLSSTRFVVHLHKYAVFLVASAKQLIAYNLSDGEKYTTTTGSNSRELALVGEFNDRLLFIDTNASTLFC